MRKKNDNVIRKSKIIHTEYSIWYNIHTLSNEYKLLMYKAILKPIWCYGVQLWGCAKPSNTKIIQRVQSKILRTVFNAPRYISNKTLHEDSGTPFVEDEISKTQ